MGKTKVNRTVKHTPLRGKHGHNRAGMSNCEQIISLLPPTEWITWGREIRVWITAWFMWNWSWSRKSFWGAFKFSLKEISLQKNMNTFQGWETVPLEIYIKHICMPTFIKTTLLFITTGIILGNTQKIWGIWRFMSIFRIHSDQLKVIQNQTPPPHKPWFASFVYVVWNLNIKQSWQIGMEAKLHSASGFSEQKYVKEKECDSFCSIILGKIISNTCLRVMIFPSLGIYVFLFISYLLLLSEIYLLVTSLPFGACFYIMYPDYVTSWYLWEKYVLTNAYCKIQRHHEVHKPKSILPLILAPKENVCFLILY